MFSAFEFNHAYEETDVLVSLAKLKNHADGRGDALAEESLRSAAELRSTAPTPGTKLAIGPRFPLHNPKGLRSI